MAPIVVLYVSIGHKLQAVSPGDYLKVPATHASQGPPSFPLWPALQTQSVTLVARDFSTCELAGQTVHCESESSPSELE